MTRSTSHDVPVLSGFDHAVDNDVLERWPQRWDELREQAPVFRSDIAPWDLWFVLRYDDVAEAFGDPERFSSRQTLYHVEDPHRWIPSGVDPPEHTFYRQVLNPFFARGAVEAFEPDMRARIRELVALVAPNGSCDLMAEVALRYPAAVFMQMMGMDLDDLDILLGWASSLMHTSAAQDPDGSIRADTARTVYRYIRTLVERRRGAPDGGIVSSLLDAEVGARRLTDAEIVEIGYLLFTAGMDTVAGTLGYVFAHLARHHDLRRTVVEQPDRINDVVDELLRLYGIASMARVVQRDTEIGGCPVAAGDRLVLVTASANRDPRRFESPTECVPGREHNRHLTFGGGIHRCLGAALARAEIRIALEEWHRLIPDYRIAADAQLISHVGGAAGYHDLPLEWAQ
jgi:cytochrome P450